ncbi:ABC transporter permease [Novilysobacter spongiicola]|uniref:Putative ABC transport system permease protein n=1 Tax=Lysobacter spongiicola DSM 21749 TaxID=1122188 RepID=A0A1T4RR50_9GAMM|nr:ABC transporter permease [Lysobacter spongiicola]SKA18357.1 putative ABC transport system permease protein [Lysobacter spongiicola DSM 21749]
MNRWLHALPPIWREAIEELWRRRLRTGLTLLGLIFGVGAIVAMQAVGEGSRREALRMVESLGLHNLIVETVHQDEDTRKENRERSLGLSVADGRAALAVVPGAEAYAVEKEVRTHSVFSDSGRSDARASGVSDGFFQLSSLQVGAGRALNDDDAAALSPVAVLGSQAAADLFPAGDAVGRHVKVNHVWLEVVGVLADRDLGEAKFEGMQLGLESNRIYVPLPSARARFRFEPLEDEVDRVLLKLADPGQLMAGARVFAAVLDQRHAGAGDYRLVVPQQLFRQHQQTQRIFRVVMGAIAGVSLLVGGIGIMNIMLANVLERRREIGLLRALGARQHDVIAQFLREAAVICVAGALLGLLFGVLLAYSIALFADWQVAWAPMPIVLSVAFCALVGLGFGVYPARQAARLNPIAALRHD